MTGHVLTEDEKISYNIMRVAKANGLKKFNYDCGKITLDDGRVIGPYMNSIERVFRYLSKINKSFGEMVHYQYRTPAVTKRIDMSISVEGRMNTIIISEDRFMIVLIFNSPTSVLGFVQFIDEYGGRFYMALPVDGSYDDIHDLAEMIKSSIWNTKEDGSYQSISQEIESVIKEVLYKIDSWYKDTEYEGVWMFGEIGKENHDDN